MGLNRKGALGVVFLMIFLIIVLFAFAFVAFFAYNIFDEVKTDMLPELELNQSKDILNDMGARYPSVFDGLIIFLFFLLWGALIVSAFFMDEHPIFFAFTLILMIFVVIAGLFIGNFYEDIFKDDTMTGVAASFPMSNWMLTHFLSVSIVVAFSVMLVLYAKSR